jgi:hypothetical protein
MVTALPEALMMKERTVARTQSAAATAWIEAALALLIGLEILFKYRLLFHLNISWDEFLYLSKIYEYECAALSYPLQTFYVHFFGWLPLVSGNEVTQIMWARGVAYAFALGPCVLTYSIGRLYLCRTASLFAALVYLSFSHVIEHGTAFRADPIGAFLFLAALWLVLRRPGSRFVGAVAALYWRSACS